jgi:O-methyltransferase
LGVKPTTDYVRYATLALCADEISRRCVPGAVAELGVYKGKFAAAINKLFPLKSLYLFDTFSGFDDTDKKLEKKHFNSAVMQDFSNVSINAIMARMPYPSNVFLRIGHFPSSAVNLPKEWSFVNIDVDLYGPTLAGLSFFYPQISNGGYIFVHDYNNDAFPGARSAVREFCDQRKISFVPIPDSGGTVIIPVNQY